MDVGRCQADFDDSAKDTVFHHYGHVLADLIGTTDIDYNGVQPLIGIPANDFGGHIGILLSILQTEEPAQPLVFKSSFLEIGGLQLHLDEFLSQQLVFGFEVEIRRNEGERFLKRRQHSQPDDPHDTDLPLRGRRQQQDRDDHGEGESCVLALVVKNVKEPEHASLSGRSA